MWHRISQHPFPVEAYFDYSLVLTYAYPLEALQPLIPDCLELDTFQDKYAFSFLWLYLSTVFWLAGV